MFERSVWDMEQRTQHVHIQIQPAIDSEACFKYFIEHGRIAMFCPRCGAQPAPNQAFCAKCGPALATAESAQAAAPVAQAAPLPAKAAPPPLAQPSYSPTRAIPDGGL